VAAFGWTVAKCRIFLLTLVGASVLAAGCTAENDMSRAQPGDCLEALGKAKKTIDFQIVDCEAPIAAYKVARRLVGSGMLSCGSSTYGYADSARTRRSTRRWHLCLMLNAKVGDCFHQEVGFPTGKATKVVCGPSATYQVVKVAEGIADRTLCGDDAGHPLIDDLTRSIALVYPNPPVTICTDRVSAGS
jgi:hypothetical protein